MRQDGAFVSRNGASAELSTGRRIGSRSASPGTRGGDLDSQDPFEKKKKNRHRYVNMPILFYKMFKGITKKLRS